MSTIIQRSFSSGEIAPALYARVDFYKYQTGLRTCRNFFIMRHGGATNRPGTQFVGEVSDSSKTVRLIPFISSQTQAFVLEFGNLYIRIIEDGDYVKESAKTITGITQADPAVVTSNSHGYSNGDEVYISGVVGMTELNGRNFKVANVTTNTFELQYMDGTDVDSTGFTAYSSAGTAEKIYEVTTTYVEADLPDIRHVQSSDVLTIVHPTYVPAELARVGATNWTLTNITTTPDISTPTLTSVTGLAAGTANPVYTVSAIDSDTFEESYVDQTGVFQASSAEPTAANPAIINWSSVSGAQEYNVYKKVNGIYGLVGVAGTSNFTDTGATPDTTKTPPLPRNFFQNTGSRPSAVTYFQQRLIFAATNFRPERVWASRPGLFKNFSVTSPSQDDDSVVFTIAGRQVNRIMHMVDIGKLVIFTTAGEWTVGGDASGILKPTAINLRQESYNGSSALAPIVVGNNALYVQARGSIIRDLGFDYQVDGYQGNDLTLFSSHLFDDYSIVDWDYQQTPHSIIWAVRDDGTLLSLTYVRSQQLLAWSRHDFQGGTVENVCVIPEASQDALYVVVKRTIDGATKRYVERMSTRNIVDIVDSTFLDSYLSYDGRNTTATTMTLSGGTDWDYDETLTCTASAGTFTSGDVGNAIHFTDASGNKIRFEIKAYSSSTVVTGKANKTVPASLRSTAVTTWSRAVDTLTGLWHLEGEDVSVFADGFVVANPNNPKYETVTVADGSITLDKTYATIHVGLPYVSDVETLNVDSTQSETLSDKNKNIQKVTMFVEESRGIFVGAAPPSDDSTDILEGLTEMKIRSNESYDAPVSLKTGTINVNIQPEWNSNGRVFVRQIDPVPLSILAIAPAGYYPFRGGG